MHRQIREVYAAQKQDLNRYESELKLLLGTDLSRLNETARKLDIPHILVTATVN